MIGDNEAGNLVATDLLGDLNPWHAASFVRSSCRNVLVRVHLVFFEECQALEQARQKEHAFKNGRTRRKTIELLIATFPPERLAPFAGLRVKGSYRPADPSPRGCPPHRT